MCRRAPSIIGMPCSRTQLGLPVHKDAVYQFSGAVCDLSKVCAVDLLVWMQGLRSLFLKTQPICIDYNLASTPITYSLLQDLLQQKMS